MTDTPTPPPFDFHGLTPLPTLSCPTAIHERLAEWNIWFYFGRLTDSHHLSIRSMTDSCIDPWDVCNDNGVVISTGQTPEAALLHAGLPVELLDALKSRNASRDQAEEPNRSDSFGAKSDRTCSKAGGAQAPDPNLPHHTRDVLRRLWDAHRNTDDDDSRDALSEAIAYIQAQNIRIEELEDELRYERNRHAAKTLATDHSPDAGNVVADHFGGVTKMVAPSIRAIGPGWIEDAEGSCFNVARCCVAWSDSGSIHLFSDGRDNMHPKAGDNRDQPAELRAAIVDAINWRAGRA